MQYKFRLALVNSEPRALCYIFQILSVNQCVQTSRKKENKDSSNL